MKKLLLKLTLVAVVALAPVAWATPSQQDAVALVKKAVATYKRSGKDRLIAQINTDHGPFHQGELYALAYDLRGTVVADPINQTLRGQNLYNVPDSSGKLF